MYPLVLRVLSVLFFIPPYSHVLPVLLCIMALYFHASSRVRLCFPLYYHVLWLPVLLCQFPCYCYVPHGHVLLCFPCSVLSPFTHINLPAFCAPLNFFVSLYTLMPPRLLPYRPLYFHVPFLLPHIPLQSHVSPMPPVLRCIPVFSHVPPFFLTYFLHTAMSPLYSHLSLYSHIPPALPCTLLYSHVSPCTIIYPYTFVSFSTLIYIPLCTHVFHFTLMFLCSPMYTSLLLWPPLLSHPSVLVLPILHALYHYCRGRLRNSQL